MRTIQTEIGVLASAARVWEVLTALPILAMIGTNTREGFESMNKALKARAEHRDG